MWRFVFFIFIMAPFLHAADFYSKKILLSKFFAETHEQFHQEAQNYTDLIKNFSEKISLAEKISYHFIITRMQYKNAFFYHDHRIRNLLLKQKKTMKDRENTFLEKTIDTQKNPLIEETEQSGIATLEALSDTGWELANIAENYGPLRTKISLPPILNLAASQLGFVITGIQAYDTYKIKKHNSKIEPKLSSILLELKELEESIEHEKENPHLLYLELDYQHLTDLIKQFNNQKNNNETTIREMIKDFIVNSFLSSAYFTSSVISAWPSPPLAAAIIGNTLGGSIYGTILCFFAAKGMYNSYQALTLIKKEIKELEVFLGKISPTATYEKCFFALKLSQLKYYKKIIRQLDLGKNALTIALGACTAIIGTLGVLSATGIIALPSLALLIPGYGVLGFLGGALILSGIKVAKKHHWGERIKLMITKKKAHGKDPVQLSDYYKSKKERKSLINNIHIQLQKIDELADQHNFSLKQNAPLEKLREDFNTLVEAVSTYLKYAERMIQIYEEQTDFRFLLSLKKNKDKENARILSEGIQTMSNERMTEFCSYIGIKIPHFFNIEQKRKFLKMEIVQAILGK